MRMKISKAPLSIDLLEITSEQRDHRCHRVPAMATVETVQGQVDASELGVTLIHEHLRFRDEAVAENWPGRYDEQAELDAALEATRAAQEHGVKTIVDPTAMFGGRDVNFLKRVSDETGIHVVACTGIYTYD